jgi:hypothetical protein
VRVTLRPTIAADLPLCFAAALPHRIKAITALAGEEILGCGGIGFRPDGTVVAFAQILPTARRYPAAIHRAGRMAIDLMVRARVPLVIAEAQDDNPAAERWLLRLGFERTEISGFKAFVWRRTECA